MLIREYELRLIVDFLLEFQCTNTSDQIMPIFMFEQSVIDQFLSRPTFGGDSGASYHWWLVCIRIVEEITVTYAPIDVGIVSGILGNVAFELAPWDGLDWDFVDLCDGKEYSAAGYSHVKWAKRWHFLNDLISKIIVLQNKK
jgi:hypothetical protein